MIFFIIILIALLLAGLIYQRKRAGRRKVVKHAFGCTEAYRLIAKPHNIDQIKGKFEQLKKPDERYFYSIAISRKANLEQLCRWALAEPNNPHANLCYGVRLAQYAWQSTIAQENDEIGTISNPAFRQQVEVACGHLLVAARQAPSDPTPFIFLITYATWLGDGVERYFYYYNQAIHRDPQSWGANMAMVVALSQKWGGDNQHMLKFANQVAKQAPLGCDLKLLPYKAYLELWKYHRDVEQNTPAANNVLANADLIAQSRVWFIEWRQANVQYKSSVFARYNALSWLWLLGEEQLAATIFAEVSDKINDVHLKWTGLEGQLARMQADLG